MGTLFIILSILLILISILPFIKHQHWVFRTAEFIKIQLILLQLITIVGLFVFTKKNTLFWSVFTIQILLILYHSYLLLHYTKFYKIKHKRAHHPNKTKIISANIYQFNKHYNRFINLIEQQQPDIFVSMESNKDWEVALQKLEKQYPHTQKVTLENTYGMHLYSKIPFESVKTHFFVADDVPSIEAHFKTEDGKDFILFCVHPPPPSPTEEETSKERDGDLLSVAKLVKRTNKPTLVIGDFNSVAWSTISKLFRKNSELIDGRKGRGILASFHAKYWFLRAPLDLVFHSTTVFINELRVLKNIGSDHFPICCVFSIDKNNSLQVDEVETISEDEKIETEKIIEQGKNEESTAR